MLLEEIFPVAAYYQDTWHEAIQSVCVAGLGTRLAEFAKPLEAEFHCEVRSLLHSDRKSTRLNSSHSQISYAVFCLKKKTALVCATVSRRRSTAEARTHIGRVSSLCRSPLRWCWTSPLVAFREDVVDVQRHRVGDFLRAAGVQRVSQRHHVEVDGGHAGPASTLARPWEGRRRTA